MRREKAFNQSNARTPPGDQAVQVWVTNALSKVCIYSLVSCVENNMGFRKKNRKLANSMWKKVKKTLLLKTSSSSSKEEEHSRIIGQSVNIMHGNHGNKVRCVFPFFLLPRLVLCDILAIYLDASSLCTLDTATSCKDNRQLLHSILYGYNGVCGQAFERHYYQDHVALEWALDRDFRFDYMNVRGLGEGDEEIYMVHENIDEIDDDNDDDDNDEEDEEGYSTSLHWASRHNECSSLVEKILKRGKQDLIRVAEEGEERGLFLTWSVNCVDSNGRTPLLIACEYGCIKNIELLVAFSHANVNVVDENFYCPLYYLCDPLGGNMLSSAQLLMKAKHGINVNIQNTVNGFSSLHRACDLGLVQIAQTIIRESLKGKYPCIPDLQSNLGNTALHHTCTVSSVAVQLTRLLLYEAKASANICNDSGQTPLHIACKENCMDVARVLLLEGAADPNIRDHSGRNILLYATENNNIEILQLLQLQVGRGLDVKSCDFNARDADRYPALHKAVTCGSYDVAKLLIESHCDVDAQGPDDSTALYRAVEFGNERMVSLLLHYGHANTTICNMDGMSPLDCALENELDAVVSLLHEAPTAEASGKVLQVNEEEADLDVSLLRDMSFGSIGGIQYKLFHNNQYLNVFTRRQAVGSDQVPLFVDDIWPGSLVLADYLQEICICDKHIRGKRVIELGAGAALPSIVSACIGAQFVCITDYPAAGVIENITNVLEHNSIPTSVACAAGHIWGEKVNPLLELGSEEVTEYYDTALMAECLWKDTSHLHKELMTSVYALLKPQGSGFFTFAHRPSSDGSHKPKDDLHIFDFTAKDVGFTTIKRLPSVIKYRDCMDINGDNVEIHVYEVIK